MPADLEVFLMKLLAFGDFFMLLSNHVFWAFIILHLIKRILKTNLQRSHFYLWKFQNSKFLNVELYFSILNFISGIAFGEFQFPQAIVLRISLTKQAKLETSHKVTWIKSIKTYLQGQPREKSRLAFEILKILDF